MIKKHQANHFHGLINELIMVKSIKIIIPLVPLINWVVSEEIISFVVKQIRPLIEYNNIMY